ncbi:hypothetical protein [Blastococcus montanus]|uniref:hypothetical protein n=1 Tax=Blastococcus montanus TaxID=3144973 RepID=UPI00320AF259
MIREEPSEFVEQMYLAVAEESWLWEVPMRTGDGRGDHAPWDSAECSRQLLGWFDAGLLEVYGDPPADTPRPRTAGEWRIWNSGHFLRRPDADTARAVLADPSRWTPTSEDGHLRLRLTEAGMAADASWV